MTDLYPEGPRIDDVLKHTNGPTAAIWGISFVFMTGSLYFWLKHRAKIQAKANEDPSLRAEDISKQIVQILWTVPVFAITTFVGLFLPRAFGLFELARSFSQAYAITAFTSFLTLKLGGKGTAVRVIPEQARQKWYVTMPLGCCLGCAFSPSRPTPRLLQFCYRATYQFTILVPYASAFGLLLVLEDAISNGSTTNHSDSVDKMLLIISLLRILSTLVATYGLQIMIRLVAEPLKTDDISSKALILKLLITFDNIQSFIISLIVRYSSDADPDSDSYQSSNEAFMSNYRVYGWMNFILCLETLPLVFLIMKAYPASEVTSVLPTARQADHDTSSTELLETSSPLRGDQTRYHASQSRKDSKELEGGQIPELDV